MRCSLCLVSNGWTYVDGNYAVVLVREETRRVVGVDHGAAREDKRVLVRREQRNGLIDPVVQVVRRSVAPVLVARHVGCRVVLVVQVPSAVGVAEHAIGVVHEALRRRVVHLRPVASVVVSRHRLARGHSSDRGSRGCRYVEVQRQAGLGAEQRHADSRKKTAHPDNDRKLVMSVLVVVMGDV